MRQSPQDSNDPGALNAFIDACLRIDYSRTTPQFPHCYAAMAMYYFILFYFFAQGKNLLLTKP